MNYWGIFLTSTGGATGILIIAFFIVKNWLKKKIEADVQHKYNSMLEEIKTENQKELEGFKAGYQKVLDENQIRFSGFYSEQSKAILKLNQKLAALYIALNNMMTTVKYVPKDEIEQQKYYDEEEKKTSKAYNDAMLSCQFEFL